MGWSAGSAQRPWAAIGLVLAWLQRLLRRGVYLLLRMGPIPQHVAFIMDGNRRFAEQCRLDRMAGHLQGYKKMTSIIQWCLEMGVTCITVYAFSIDNYKRSADEVDNLMMLAADKFRELLTYNEASEWRTELRIVGDLALAPEHVQHAAARLMHESQQLGSHRAVVNICFSYTATEEMGHAVGSVREGLASSQLLPCDVDAGLLSRCMHTRDCPPVNLLVRTSGERRLSDFLLWQSSQAHLQFIRRLWPDVSFMDLVRCIMAYQRALPDLRRVQLLNDGAKDETALHSGPHGLAATWPAGFADGAMATGTAGDDIAPPSPTPCSCFGSCRDELDDDMLQAPLERAPSVLSSISEDEPAYCPHPSGRLRTQGYIRALAERRQHWVNAHATLAH